ncbi:MAG: DNA polymerase III subunit gamma/tau [Anaerolineae bacterium]|nr:DNA polymerase III subunit gamma/tau [Anaerolineae bacterium]
MSQALYRKWRPARFDDVVGQEHVTHTLRQAIAAGRVGHAYLFSGPRGTGKTTSARLLAKAVNCLHDDPTQRPDDACSICQAIGQGRFLDLIEIDAASNTGVDDIRSLRDKINFAPSEGRYKVYIIDEVHMLSTAAFNALLKTLEEPPPHAIFVLATTEEHKVPVTIKSRCQVFHFRLLTQAEIHRRLHWMVEQEGLQIDPDALEMVARHGAGSLRDAESLLDQLVTSPDDRITLERAQAVLGTAPIRAVCDLTTAWLDGDSAAALSILQEAFISGADARQLARQVVTYLRDLLLLQTAGGRIVLDSPVELRQEMDAQAQRAPRLHLIETIKRFNEAALTPVSSWQPQLLVELALVESIAAASHVEPAVVPTPAVNYVVERPTPTVASPPPLARVTPPPAPVSQEKEVAAAPQTADGFSIPAVQARWRDLTERVKGQNRNLGALLNSAKPLAAEGKTLVLGFDFPLLKDKFDNHPGGLEIVNQILQTIFGSEYRVRVVVTGQYTPPPNPASPQISREEFIALAQELGGQVVE